jgi:PPOX class probable F420-dependent enzyme
MTPTEELAKAKYALLTTYRRDGTGVPTPVWIVPLDGALAVWSGRTAGKVKRIRRNPGVTVATCDFRGNHAGEPHAARARVLDEPGSLATRRAIVRKYGLLGRLTLLSSRLRGGLDRTVGIEISINSGTA